MIERIRTEPVLVTSLVRALITVAAAWGLHLSVEQIAAVMLTVEAVLALLVRGAVAPVSTVDAGCPAPLTNSGDS